MRLRPPPPKPDPARKLEQLLAQPQFGCVPVAICTHCQAVPLGVLVRGTLEWLLDDQMLNQLFLENAPEQYERELTFAVMVKLLIQVSAGTRPSVFAAFKKDQESDNPSITTSYQALYGKMGRLNPAVSEALVRHSADKVGPLLEEMPPVVDEPIPGYRMRVLDGNVLTGTDHRLKPLRQWLNACLPGKSLVVYEPRLGLVTDLVLCADAYTQERALLGDLLPRVRANDLWVADRNFCTTRFVFGVLHQQGFVVVRQHRRNLPCLHLGRARKCGETSTGLLYEQRVQVTDSTTGATQLLRRIEVRLFEKTRDGDSSLAVLTNLPETVSALRIAEIYRQRWTIEKHFQFITESLHCEIPGLGKPRAALLMFAMALVAGNALAVVRGSLRAAHGQEAAAEVSGYYLADEIAGDYRAVMKYLAPDQWQGWRDLSAHSMAQLLTTIAAFVRLSALTRTQRGPKKPPIAKPVYDKKHKHYSTARVLKQADDSC
jgi:Transposase DDE domain